jgi:hypothetical protein
MRGLASNIGRRRLGRFSGAQSGFAVRSVGDLPEAAPSALMNYYLFENALVSMGFMATLCIELVVN